MKNPMVQADNCRLQLQKIEHTIDVKSVELQELHSKHEQLSETYRNKRSQLLCKRDAQFTVLREDVIALTAATITASATTRAA